MLDVARAAEVVKSGGVVCFPTETFYGLAALAMDAAAIAKVIAVKGRPDGMPIACIAADATIARRLWREGRASWGEVSEFRQELLKLAIPFEPTQERGLSTSSRYFLARGDIELDGLMFHPTSLLDRERGVRVLQRSRGE